MINIACGQALFRPFFRANEARSGRGARDTCVCAFPVARVWRSLLASRLPLLASSAGYNKHCR